MALPPSRRRAPPREASSSSLAIRNVVVAGHRTSVRLEPLMWDALREITQLRGMTLHQLITEIDQTRETSSLTAAIRVYIVEFYRYASAQADRVALPAEPH
jgi:predicted DNA-binding ribbon-helix-helix protein